MFVCIRAPLYESRSAHEILENKRQIITVYLIPPDFFVSFFSRRLFASHCCCCADWFGERAHFYFVMLILCALGLKYYNFFCWLNAVMMMMVMMSTINDYLNNTKNFSLSDISKIISLKSYFKNNLLLMKLKTKIFPLFELTIIKWPFIKTLT